MNSRPSNSEATKNGGPAKAKIVTFYRSGDVNYSGYRMAISQRNYRKFETLLDELTTKVALPKGARRVHTPGGVHSVASVDALEDGRSYVVTSSKKLQPLNLDEVHRRRTWKPAKRSAVPNGGVKKLMPNGVKRSPPQKQWPSPPAGKDRTPPNRGEAHLSGRGKPSSTPKKITVVRNGDPRNKHMVLLNRRTAQNFEDILQAVSEIFNLPVRKLCTSDGTKVESLQAIFNGPDLFVALPATEKFRPFDYMDNSHPRPTRPKPGSHISHKDETDQPAKVKSRGKWRVWIATNENPAAGTDATVYMVVYGDRGKTDDIILGAGDGYFEAGNEDEFTIQIGDVGDIYKIRIGHDDSTEYAGWKCDEVRMEDVHTGEELVFSCDRWMSREEDDGDVCRELAVPRRENSLPAISYQVLVSTGDYWGAGLDGKVYITLIGERGDSGPRLLYRSDQVKAFQKGQTDVFTLEAISLGGLKGILIGHDSDKPGKGWFLDNVVIRETEGDEREFNFPCYQWLDVSMGDGAITQEISVSDIPADFESEVWEREKWKFATGNHLMLVHKTSGKALHINKKGLVQAGPDPYTKMSPAYFVVENLKNNLCVFSSLSNSSHILAMDESRPSVQAKNTPHCYFNVVMQPDCTALLESNLSKRHLSFSVAGRPIDSRVAQGPLQTYYFYAKGMFRAEGVIILYTSRTQALVIDNCGRCHATGARADHALWRVHKVKEGGVRMFENLSVPESFLQIKNGACNGKGEGDESCHFKVHKMKSEGYIKLQSLSDPVSFVGFSPDGAVIPVLDDGKTDLRMFPAVVQVGIPKKRLTPTPPMAPRVANKKKKRMRVKKVSSINEIAVSEALIDRERETEPLEEEEDTSFDDGDWRVLVRTGTVGTTSTVVLVVYGEDKVSDPIVLGKGGQLFMSGAENEFKVNLLGLGDIYKIRVGLDTMSKKASWRLDLVRMIDLATNQALTFNFKNRWLAIREGDGSLWREAAVEKAGAKPQSVNNYSVQVSTGWEPGSGTSAHVFVTLVGERGDTGRRLLHKSDDKTIFNDGQVTSFEIEAVSVRTLKSVIVEHDGRGTGKGWFCKRIVVKESCDSKSEYIFACDRWLDDGKDDSLTRRELELTERRQINENDWDVYITTGGGKESSLTAPATLVVYGSKGTTELTLMPSHHQGFLAKSVEDFRVNFSDIGQLVKVRIGHQEQDEGWFLSSLRLVDLNTGTSHDFEADRWLSPTHDDQDTWREFPIAQDGKKPSAAIKYLIHVHTGKSYGSGTKANVHLRLIGTRTDTGRRQLPRNGKKTFATGQMDLFVVEATCLGKLERVVVGHDGKGDGEGWFLDRIVVKESKNLKNDFIFQCQRWLDAGKDDGKIERELAIMGVTTEALDCVTLESTETTTDGVTVTWHSSSVITGYRVTLDPPDSTTSRIDSDDPELTQVCFEGLTPGTQYRTEIVPCNKDKDGKPVSAWATTKPAMLSNLRAQATQDTISASWEKPLQGLVTAYEVKVQPADARESTVRIEDGVVTEAEFTGLIPDRRYKVIARSLSGNEEGEVTSVFVTTESPALASAITDQSLEVTGDTLTVTWSKSGSDITGYLVTLRPLDSTPQKVRIDDPDTTRAVFDGLIGGLECEVDIVPLMVDQEPGEAVMLKGRTAPQPHQVGNPMAKSTNSTIHLTWERPAGNDLIGYLISYSAPKGSATKIKINEPDTTEATIRYLVAGRQYRCEISTLYQEMSGRRVILTQRTKPNQPENLKVSAVKAESLILSWERPLGDLSGYTVHYKPTPTFTVGAASYTDPDYDTSDGDKPGQPTHDSCDEGKEVLAEANAEEATITELMPGKSYDITMYTLSHEEISEGHSLQQFTGPEMVQDLNVIIASTSVAISWNPPASGRFDGYIATCSQGSDVASKEVPPRITSVIFEGLSERETYTVEVFALGEEGLKSEGAREVVTTANTKDLPPVQDVQLSASKDSVTVKWHKPDFDSLTGYEVSCYHIGKLDLRASGSRQALTVDPNKGDPPPEQDVHRGDLLDSGDIHVDSHHDHNSSELAPRKEENGDSGVSSEADEGKSSSPHKGHRRVLQGSRLTQLVFTTIVDAAQTEVLIGRLASGVNYRVEVATLCEERRSEVVALEMKTKSKLPPILNTDCRVTETEIQVSWYTPPLDFTGYRAICYRVHPAETGHERPESLEGGFTDPASMVKVAEELMGPEATRVSFVGLDSDTPHLVEIFMVHGTIENEAAEVVVRTVKPPKPPQVTDLTWEVEENSLTVSWQEPADQVSGFLVNVVLPSNTSLPEHPSSERGALKAPPEGEKPGLTPTKYCRDADTGELVECLVHGDMLEQRRLDAGETSTVFGNLDPGTVYAVHVASLRGDVESDWVHFVAKTMPACEDLFPVVDLEAACTRDTIQLTWSPPDGSVTGYRLKWAICPEPGEEVTDGDGRSSPELREQNVNEDDQTVTLGEASEAEDERVEIVDQSAEGIVDHSIGEKMRDVGQSGLDNKPEENGQAALAERGSENGENYSGDENGEIAAITYGGESVNHRGEDNSDSGNDGSFKDGEDGRSGQSRGGLVELGAEESSFDIEGLHPCTKYLIQVWTLDGADVSDPVEITAKTYGDWTVRVFACDDSPRDQQASLSMTIVGCSASEDAIPLTRRERTLKDELNIFQILSEDIEDVYKIRFEVTDMDLQCFQGFHIKQVSLVHNTTAQELLFEGDVWLRRGKPGIPEDDPTNAALKSEDDLGTGSPTADQEDGNSKKDGAESDVEEVDCSDFVAELPLADSSLSVVTYEVEVHTEDTVGVSTKSGAYITLHGSRGNTGKRELWRSNQDVMFQPGQVDLFSIRAVDIGSIERVTLGHAIESFSHDWKVSKVIVSSREDPSSSVTFPCLQWLSRERSDALTEIVLDPSDGEDGGNSGVGVPVKSVVDRKKGGKGEKQGIGGGDEEQEVNRDGGNEEQGREEDDPKLDKEPNMSEKGRRDKGEGEVQSEGRVMGDEGEGGDSGATEEKDGEEGSDVKSKIVDDKKGESGNDGGEEGGNQVGDGSRGVTKGQEEIGPSGEKTNGRNDNDTAAGTEVVEKVVDHDTGEQKNNKEGIVGNDNREGSIIGSNNSQKGSSGDKEGDVATSTAANGEDDSGSKRVNGDVGNESKDVNGEVTDEEGDESPKGGDESGPDKSEDDKSLQGATDGTLREKKEGVKELKGKSSVTEVANGGSGVVKAES